MNAFNRVHVFTATFATKTNFQMLAYLHFSFGGTLAAFDENLQPGLVPSLFGSEGVQHKSLPQLASPL